MTKLEKQILGAITGNNVESAKAAAEVAKRYIVEYNTFIQANISRIVPDLKDHGAHAVFCDKLNDLRNKFLVENGSNKGRRVGSKLENITRKSPIT